MTFTTTYKKQPAFDLFSSRNKSKHLNICASLDQWSFRQVDQVSEPWKKLSSKVDWAINQNNQTIIIPEDAQTNPSAGTF